MGTECATWRALSEVLNGHSAGHLVGIQYLRCRILKFLEHEYSNEIYNNVQNEFLSVFMKFLQPYSPHEYWKCLLQ